MQKCSSLFSLVFSELRIRHCSQYELRLCRFLDLFRTDFNRLSYTRFSQDFIVVVWFSKRRSRQKKSYSVSWLFSGTFSFGRLFTKAFAHFIWDSMNMRQRKNTIYLQASNEVVLVLVSFVCCSRSVAPLTRLKTPRASDSKFTLVPQPARQSFQPRRELRSQPVWLTESRASRFHWAPSGLVVCWNWWEIRGNQLPVLLVLTAALRRAKQHPLARKYMKIPGVRRIIHQLQVVCEILQCCRVLAFRQKWVRSVRIQQYC